MPEVLREEAARAKRRRLERSLYEAPWAGKEHGRKIVTVLRDGDQRLTRWMAAWDSD